MEVLHKLSCMLTTYAYNSLTQKRKVVQDLGRKKSMGCCVWLNLFCTQRHRQEQSGSFDTVNSLLMQGPVLQSHLSKDTQHFTRNTPVSLQPTSAPAKSSRRGTAIPPHHHSLLKLFQPSHPKTKQPRKKNKNKTKKKHNNVTSIKAE